MLHPQFAIGVNHQRSARVIDGFKETATDNLRRFVVSRWAEVRRLSTGYALKFRHSACEKLVLIGESVYALAVRSDRERIHNRRARGALYSRQQRLEERRELVTPAHVLHAAEILAKLVQNH
jgi:hypothetical protein